MLMMGGIHFKTLVADNGISVFHDTDKEKKKFKIATMYYNTIKHFEQSFRADLGLNH